MTQQNKGPVTQEWIHSLSFMQQTVLLTAIRGPDGTAKYHQCKYLLRWYRRCILISAMDGAILDTPYATGGGSFTGPSFDATTFASFNDWRPIMDRIFAQYLKALDELPHHYQLHFMHAAEILGYKHPNPIIRAWWNSVYISLVHDMHVWPESEEQLDARLGDNREQWLARNHAATTE